MMNLSMTTDYVTYLGDPEPYLRRIADAGFTHIHWCHEWNTDYIYSREEVKRIGKLLDSTGLRLLDLHAPHGTGRGWGSPDEAKRRSAVELVKNRIGMTADLSGGAVVLHLPDPRNSPDHPGVQPVSGSFGEALHRSLGEFEMEVRGSGVVIALENLGIESMEGIALLFEEYSPEFLGLCYDSGHGNICGGNFFIPDGHPRTGETPDPDPGAGSEPGLDFLDRVRDRLVSVHIHDNDGKKDLHDLPFSGTVDWPGLSALLAASSYRGCVSLESNMRGLDIDEELFLDRARWAAAKLTRMIDAVRI